MRQAFAWPFSKAFKDGSPHTFHPKARSPDPATTACGWGDGADLLFRRFGMFNSQEINVEVEGRPQVLLEAMHSVSVPLEPHVNSLKMLCLSSGNFCVFGRIFLIGMTTFAPPSIAI